MADRIGQRLGNYTLIRKLGEGGFAEVYLGEHIHLGTQAAIKMLHTRLSSADVNQFRTEARTIARLVHPNIVRILEFGIEDKTPFLVMDFAINGTLRQRHAKGTILPLPTVVSYVRQVADALKYAHDDKLIHRDVKPENMLLGRRNEVLLSDFGIALVAQSSRYQSTQQMAGTMAYMSPEQIQGKPRPASDQYSLGIVVYEWLTGDRPFHGTAIEIVTQHLAVSPTPLREKVPTISRDVEQVVLTALAKDHKERFGSVLAFATALEQACQTTSSHPVSLSMETILPGEASPLTDGVAAISPSQPPLPAPVVTPPNQSSRPAEAVLEGESSQVPPASMPVPLSAPPLRQSLQPIKEAMPSLTKELAPLGRYQPSQHNVSRRGILVGLATIVVVGSGGLVWLAISHGQQVSSSPLSPTAATPTPTPPAPSPTALPLGTTLYTYRGHSEGVTAVAWSPDDKRIASGDLNQTVQVWDAADGGHPYTYRGHSILVSAVVWSPDNKRIASASADGTVQVWDAADGGHPYTYRGHTLGVLGVAWSFDGRRIASASADGTVQVWDATDGGHPYTYRGHSAVVDSVAWSPDSKRLASGGRDNIVQVWDATDGGHPYTYRGHSAAVGEVGWSPDGKRIASTSSDKTVQVWDAADGGHPYTYRGHSDLVYAVTWSFDGKRIASAGADGTVQVWDAADGGHPYTYRGHSSVVYAVAWSPDGKHLASASNDHTVQVWQAS